MPEHTPAVKTFIEFENLRDILSELESARVRAITTRVDELIARAKETQEGKLDGFAGLDKKDGGKDCGTDGKEDKEGSEDKEACDPEGSFMAIYGNPANLKAELLNAVLVRKAARIRAII